MREFCLKMIIREECRTWVECGKFRRLSDARILFAYISKIVSKSIHMVHVSAEHYLSKRFRGLNLVPLHMKTGNEILAKAFRQVLTERALKRVLVIVKATVLLHYLLRPVSYAEFLSQRIKLI